MNDIQSLIDRHLGIYSRLNYDYVLKRLVVQDEESYYGLQNTNVVDIYDQNPPIFACRFAEASGYEHVLALANEDGRVAIQDTTTTKTARMLEGFQCHNNAVFDLAWMPGHMNFVTVSGDHSAALWDVGGGSLRVVVVFAAHTRSVKTAVFRPPPATPAVFATGARDGHVIIWDTRAATQPTVVIKPDNWLANCHTGATPKTPGSHGKRARMDPRAVSITGLTFRDEITLLSCGECDGNIKVWDLRKNYTAFKREPLPKYSIPYCGSSTRNGYTNLIVDESHTRLYASCMDNVIYCFNVATYSALPERRYIGHENSTFYIKACLSPDGAYLVSGSSDKHAYIWNVKHSLPVAKLTGHRAEVTCAAWCQREDVKIVTCSDDARHMIWRVGPELSAREELRGWAEGVPRGESPPAWGTPSSLKRRASTTPTSLPNKKPRPERKTKRCLATLLEASRDAEDTEMAVKRLRLEPKEGRSGTKRPRETTPPPTWTYPPPQPGTSFMSPSKNYELTTCRHLTPRKRKSESPNSPNKIRVISFTTPTKDLPDYVMNGEAPHLRLMSPPVKKADTTDWLTRLARSRRTEPKVPSEPKGTALSPKETVPQRRNSTDKAPKLKSGTLLKYFTLAGKKN